jgi:hypothetical protein
VYVDSSVLLLIALFRNVSNNEFYIYINTVLLEERALLLGATDQHEQALAIYAHKIKNFDLAMR